MRVLRALFFPFMICALQTNAQTELDGKGILSGNDAALRTMEFYNRLMMDSAKYVIDAMKANLLPTPMESSELSYLNTYKDKAMHDIGLAGQHAPMGVKSFNLWSGGHLSINGTTNRMLGLMVFQTGSLSLHQDFGRFQLSASAMANKYWMPMQSTLYTQYGFGGTIGYDLSDAVSLHFRLLLCPQSPRRSSLQSVCQHYILRRLCRHSLQRPLWLEYWCTSLHQSHVGPLDHRAHRYTLYKSKEIKDRVSRRQSA